MIRRCKPSSDLQQPCSQLASRHFQWVQTEVCMRLPSRGQQIKSNLPVNIRREDVFPSLTRPTSIHAPMHMQNSTTFLQEDSERRSPCQAMAHPVCRDVQSDALGPDERMLGITGSLCKPHLPRLHQQKPASPIHCVLLECKVLTASCVPPGCGAQMLEEGITGPGCPGPCLHSRHGRANGLQDDAQGCQGASLLPVGFLLLRAFSNLHGLDVWGSLIPKTAYIWRLMHEPYSFKLCD